MISKDDYSNFKQEGFSIIPLVRDVAADGESPISLYCKIAHQENTFLLESVEGGDTWAQYSIIGLDCTDSIKVSGSTIQTQINGKNTSFDSSDPLQAIQEIISSDKAPLLDNMPRFYGGYVGFFAYESAQYAEERIADLPHKTSKFTEHMPDILLVKAKKLIVFDNSNQTTQLILNACPQEDTYEEAQAKLDEMKAAIMQGMDVPPLQFKHPTQQFEFNSNFSKKDYLNAVLKAKKYIEAGDVMQVVLAQDFSARFEQDSFALYRAIRELNPSPYMYFLNLKECQIVGASPEILVRLEGQEITLRPLAGTRKRGESKAEDLLNEKDLLSDPKEVAEHLMLIDLGRNDIGRVSNMGTVKVTEKMMVEKYSHVMHIVSNVVGELSENLDCFDALKATLPAGTLSGAPKIRAMEIINELEPSSRGIYGGAIGYIAWDGSMDTAIAIRTAVIRDGVIHVGAGAGIVADSVPENEWEECRQKSKVFMDAIEMIS